MIITHISYLNLIPIILLSVMSSIHHYISTITITISKTFAILMIIYCYFSYLLHFTISLINFSIYNTFRDSPSIDQNLICIFQIVILYMFNCATRYYHVYMYFAVPVYEHKSIIYFNSHFFILSAYIVFLFIWDVYLICLLLIFSIFLLSTAVSSITYLFFWFLLMDFYIFCSYLSDIYDYFGIIIFMNDLMNAHSTSYYVHA